MSTSTNTAASIAGGLPSTLAAALSPSEDEAAKLLGRLATEDVGSTSVDSVQRDLSWQPSAAFGKLAKLTLNVRGALGVQVLNGPEDEDPDGVAGIKPADAGQLGPQLPLGADQLALIKYRLEAGLKAGASVDGTVGPAPIAFEFEAGASAVLADYRAHDRSHKLLRAVVDDLQDGPRLAFELDHVKALGAGSAVAVRLQGKLGASIEVSWSDVFTTHLGEVLDAAGVRRIVGLNIDAGVKLKASIGVVDDFVVVFSRVDAATWRVGLRKARERRLGAGFEAGVSVGLDEPARQAVESVVTAILGRPLAEVQEVLAAADPGQLPAEQRAVLDLVLERLGLSELPDALAHLREEVAGLEKKVKAGLKKAAESKLKVAFAYEYSRVSTSTALFQAKLTEPELVALHSSLVWGRLQEALARPGLDIERYLNERTVVRKRAWGFTLGLAKWSMKGTDQDVLKKVERLDREGRVQRSYEGCRSYEGKWIGRDWSWSGDFQAQMPGFSGAKGRPRVSEYEMGMAFTWQQSAPTLTADDVDELLDTAALWRIVPAGSLSHARKMLWPFVNQPYKATVHLTVDHGTLWRLRSVLAHPEKAGLDAAAALAAAMPWWPDIRPFTPEQRQATYRELWAYHLANEHVRGSALSNVARQTLKNAGPEVSSLALFEDGHKARSHTFTGLIDLNRDTAAQLRRFTRGMESLEEGWLNGEDDNDRIPKIYHDLASFWTQAHHVRALGAYLLAAARLRNCEADVRRSLKLTPQNEEGPQVVIGSRV